METKKLSGACPLGQGSYAAYRLIFVSRALFFAYKVHECTYRAIEGAAQTRKTMRIFTRRTTRQNRKTTMYIKMPKHPPKQYQHCVRVPLGPEAQKKLNAQRQRLILFSGLKKKLNRWRYGKHPPRGRELEEWKVKMFKTKLAIQAEKDKLRKMHQYQWQPAPEPYRGIHPALLLKSTPATGNGYPKIGATKTVAPKTASPALPYPHAGTSGGLEHLQKFDGLKIRELP